MRRRTFVKSLGAAAATLAAPFTRLLAADTRPEPLRVVYLHFPAGTYRPLWSPTGDGRDFQLSPILKVLEPLRDQMVVIDGVDIKRDYNCPGDNHGPGMVQLMTGAVTMSSTRFRDPIASKPSIDQVLSSSPSLQGAKYPSIQLGADASSSVDPAHYHRVLSYAGPELPIEPERDPRQVYLRLFGNLQGGRQDVDPAQLLREKRSVLDLARQDLNRLAAALPSEQRPKLERHLEGIRLVERIVADRFGAMPLVCRVPEETRRASEAPETDFEARGKLQLELLRLALACDLTRVATFTWSPGTSNLDFSTKIPGVPSVGHHIMTHWTDEQRAAPTAAINSWYYERYGEFVRNLMATPGSLEGDVSLLQRTLVVIVTELADEHKVQNLPLVLFGQFGGKLQTGRVVRYEGRSTNDLHLSVAQAAGMPLTSFGDADKCVGPLPGLFS